MKTITLFRHVLLLAILQTAICGFIESISAQVPQLLLDINPSGSSFPHNFKEYNGKLYFAAENINGVELWSTDGTTSGTQIFLDINPGSNGSFPSFLTEYNGELYFSANNGTNGNELWKTNGLPADTHLVFDINPGANGSFPLFHTVFNGLLYFSADDGINGRELWVSDGTSSGTQLFMDINVSGSSFPGHLTVFNGQLYFIANDGVNGFELWKTDGSTTQMVADINSFGSSNPGGLTIFDGLLYFSATNGVDGVELWKTDGTLSGTQMVADINPSGDSSPNGMTEFNGKLYFAADNGMNGSELWSTDGTTSGTQMVADINPGINSSFPINFYVYDGILFFAADNGIDGNELWTTEGTPSSTQQFPFPLNPGPSSSFPGGLTQYDSLLYFTSFDDVYGRQLWSSNGVTAQMHSPVQPPNPNALDNIFELKVFDGSLYFSAEYNPSQGHEPYSLTISCDAPSNLNLFSVSETEAIIEWNASPDEFDGYNWVVMLQGEDPDVDTPVVTGTEPTGHTNAFITGLTANTDYDFYIQTNCASGIFMITGPYEMISFTTQNLSLTDNTIPGFVYYPNPAGEEINLSAHNPIEKVALYNMAGQKIMENQIGSSKVRLDIGHLATGVYLLEVSSNKQTGIYRILKK